MQVFFQPWLKQIDAGAAVRATRDDEVLVGRHLLLLCA